MCGICGIINFDQAPVKKSDLERMMGKMKHRGPDDQGIFQNQHYGFGFVRLSVIDLSAMGHQPMFDRQHKYMIIHNGEVYNYKQLRHELREKGYRFCSNTDTEVILYSYMEWGAECQNRFNGMWAFCIFSITTGEIFMSRDRFGIKPFYYYQDDRKMVFASEIPPILSVLEGKPGPNMPVIYDYLSTGRTDQNSKTFYEKIVKLDPAHQMTIRGGHIKVEKWYNLNDHLNHPFQNSREYYETLQSAIELRLQSDVPLGVCLSGGLDSSSIASIILKSFHKKDLNTFSAVYAPGQKGDETEYIHEFTGFIKNMHYTRPSAEILLKDLPRFTQAHGEPTPSAASYAQYRVMRLARGKVVVTLDGQGADEQLAGYHYYFGYFFRGMFRKLQWFRLFKEIFYYLKIHQSAYALKLFIYYILPLFLKKLAGNKSVLNTDFFNTYAKKSDTRRILSEPRDLKQSLITHFEKKLAILLKWEDRNSMWYSLESRVPFLDYRLVEKTLALPGSELLKEGITKVILRKAMKGVLPEKIRCRSDKMGFDTPQDEWFRRPLLEKYIWGMLNSREFKDRDIIDQEKARILYQKHLDKKQNLADEIWKWINLDLWFKKFID